MRRGRKRKVKPTLPGMGGAIIQTVTVQNPYDPSKNDTVARVFGRSAIQRIFMRGRLHNIGEPQTRASERLWAAERLAEIFEKAGGKGAGAIVYQIKVDNSPSYDGLTNSEAWNIRELGRIRKEIGEAHAAILWPIVCEGTNFMDFMVETEKQPTRLQRLDGYQRLRDALDALEYTLNIARGPKYGRIRAFR